MAKTWIIDSRGFARKVKNATQLSHLQVENCRRNVQRECPNCHLFIDNSDVLSEWPGLPAGVKFDPSDRELLEHLAGKIGLSKSHMFIDEFIPTLEENEGICYTHPEKLPGVKKDGNSAHFFHKTSNAYSTGHRKRRRIHDNFNIKAEHVRWHKTGKTKPVMADGIQIGFKKIMVLYKSSKKGTKPDKSNWVMHQYHLGTEEDERQGEFVVSKVFYQQHFKQTLEMNEKNDLVHEESIKKAARCSPRTPRTSTPHRLPREFDHLFDDVDEDDQKPLPDMDTGLNLETPEDFSTVSLKDETIDTALWTGELPQAEKQSSKGIDTSLLCHEILDNCSYMPYGGSQTCSQGRSQACGLADLDSIELGTLPDFDLADLQFGSQDSIFGWIDRLSQKCK